MFLDAGGEEFLDGAFADGEALGLHEVPRVGGDLVELVLEGIMVSPDLFRKQKQILRSPPPKWKTFGAPFTQDDTSLG